MNNMHVAEFKSLNKDASTNAKRANFEVKTNQGDLARVDSKNHLAKSTTSGDGRATLSTLKNVVGELKDCDYKKHHKSKRPIILSVPVIMSFE